MKNKNEDAKAAILSCFRLIEQTPVPVTKHKEVLAALSFLDSLHTQLENEDKKAEPANV